MLRQLTGSGDEIRIFPSNCYWYYLSTLLKHRSGAVQHRSSPVGAGAEQLHGGMRDVVKPAWRICTVFCLGLLHLVCRSPTRYLALFWKHLTCFAFSTYYSCLHGFWFADLLATTDLLRCFTNETRCHHPLAHSRTWLSAPQPSPLPLSSQGLHLCLAGSAGMDVPATRPLLPAWKLLAKRREGSVISRHYPSHAFCSPPQVMRSICISYVQSVKLKGSTISASSWEYS